MNSALPQPIQTLSTSGGDAFAGSMLLTISGALLLVMVAIVVTAFWLRRSRWGGALTGEKNMLSVRHRHALGQREQVVIVEVTGRWLLLGVTAGSITLLAELDQSQCEAEKVTRASAGNFQHMLLRQLNKKPENKQ